MKATLLKQFGDYLYHRLPKVYRDYDVAIDRKVNDEIKRFYTLKEYLYCLAEGGFQPLLEDLEAIVSLLDPMNCPQKFLPLLLQHFGLDFVEDIPIKFQRRLVQNIAILYKKKGTLPAVAFLARELSGFDVSIEETERGNVEFAIVKLNAYDDELAELLLAQEVIQRYIHLFLPTRAKAEIVVTYGFTENIHINSSVTLDEYADYDLNNYNSLRDHVRYDVNESDEGSYISLIDENYFYEVSNLLSDAVEDDFTLVKISNGLGDVESESFDFYPCDTSSLTNMIEGDFVFTNGSCCEDTISMTESTNGEPFISRLPHVTRASVTGLHGNAVCEVFPIHKSIKPLLKGTLLEFKYEGVSYGYLKLERDLYASETYPTTFQLDPYNKAVRIYNQYFTETIDANYEVKHNTGYNSFYVTLKNGFPQNFLDSNDLGMYYDCNVNLKVSDYGYYGTGVSNTLYIYIRGNKLYMSCGNTVSTIEDMIEYLREHPLTLHLPVKSTTLQVCGETIAMKYLSPMNESSESPEIIDCRIFNSEELHSVFTEKGKVFMESSTLCVYQSDKKIVYDLGIPLRRLGNYKDSIIKEGDKYYLYKNIESYGLDEITPIIATSGSSYNSGNGVYGCFKLNSDISPVVRDYLELDKDYYYFNLLPSMPMESSKYLFSTTKNDEGVDVPCPNAGDMWDFIHLFNRLDSTLRGVVINVTNWRLLYGFNVENDLYLTQKMWKECFKYSDVEPKFYIIGNTTKTEITDESIIKKLNLLPIFEEYAIIDSDGIKYSGMEISINSKIYY